MQLSFEAVTPAMLDSLVESFKQKSIEAQKKIDDLPQDWKHLNRVAMKSERLGDMFHTLAHKAMESSDCSEAGKSIFVPLLLGFELAIQMSQMEELQKLLN